MTWLLIGVLIWVALAIPLALLIGRSIRVAETKQAAGEDLAPNFVATDTPPAEVQPENPAEPWIGPSTVPFASSRRADGGDRTPLRRTLPPVVRHPVRPVERDPNARDSGLN